MLCRSILPYLPLIAAPESQKEYSLCSDNFEPTRVWTFMLPRFCSKRSLKIKSRFYFFTVLFRGLVLGKRKDIKCMLSSSLRFYVLSLHLGAWGLAFHMNVATDCMLSSAPSLCCTHPTLIFSNLQVTECLSWMGLGTRWVKYIGNWFFACLTYLNAI